jgi:uncharacterized YccA/Bax inhibitor family protein
MSWSQAGAATMTVQGTAIKTLILTAILMVTAAWAWIGLQRGDLSGGILMASVIVGLVTALITIFRPTVAPYTAPLYAAAQGVALGTISAMYNNVYHGIVVNAASLTMMTLFVMLVIYSNRWITVTNKLRTGIVAATGAVALVYLISIVMNLFGVPMPYIHSAGPIGIAFSVFVVGLAAFNLLLDFDFIERGAYQGLPKTMEWYGGFGLLVTLIWLYLEILRLLAKLQDRR